MQNLASLKIEKMYQRTKDMAVGFRDVMSSAVKEKSFGECLTTSNLVTNRITEAMAWVMNQKAVMADEITQEEALKTMTVLDREKLFRRPPPTPSEAINAYEKESFDLYTEVVRMEDLLRKSVSSAE